MAVFGASLIATGTLHMCIPQFILLAKGTFAAVTLLTLLEEDPAPAPRKQTYVYPSLSNITFTYPTRPILKNIFLSLPAHKLSFIIGLSGSGKSTIAQLLLGLYSPNSGEIHLNFNLDPVSTPAPARAHAPPWICRV